MLLAVGDLGFIISNGGFVNYVAGEWGLDNSDVDAGFNTSDELESLHKYLVKAS